MTKLEEDMQFTGAYTSHADEKSHLVWEAKGIREKYKCKARVVQEYGGWSIYADQKYRDLTRLEKLSLRANKILDEKANLREKFEKDMANLEAEADNIFWESRKIRDQYGEEFTEDFMYAN